jgi:branched-chain amino acid transport system permease protein
MGSKRLALIGLLALVLAIAYPFVLSSSEAQTIMFWTLIYVTLATAWNLIGGYAGYISLGHAVYFGLGAYTVAILSTTFHQPGGYGLFAWMLVAGAVAGVVALPLGFIALRLRSLHSFVIVTIAYLFMFQLLASNLINLTNGTAGLAVSQPSWSPQFYTISAYFAALILAALTVLLSAWIRGSRFGLGLLAIRDDEDKAAGVGVDTWRYKFAAYVISAVPCGIAGALAGYFFSYIYPQTVFDPLVDLAIVVSAFLGGMGTLIGPILGALLIQPAQQVLTVVTGASDWNMVLFGAVFLVVIRFMPSGIVPTIAEWWRLRAKRRTAPLNGGVSTPEPTAEGGK